MHSRESPTPSTGNKTRSGPQQTGTKSEVAASPLPSRRPKRGRKCYINTPFSGIPNKEDQNPTWLSHPCLLRGPKEGGNAMSPLHSRGSPRPSAASKIKSGCLTPAFSRAQKRAEILHRPCILGDPRQRGTKSEVTASAIPSRRPRRGRKCYVALAFSGIPNAERGEQK